MNPSDLKWVVGQALLFAALILSPRGPAHLVNPLWIEVGALVFTLAVIAPAAARLGRAFTAAPTPRSEGTLAEAGLYAWVRHPMYAALLLAIWAFALGSVSPLRWAVAGALTVFFHAKARHEEGLLVARYPGYADYATRVPRFVPRRPR